MFLERIFELICDDDGITLEKLLRINGISRRTLVMLKRTPMGITRNGELCRSVDILQRGDRVILHIPEKEGCRLEPNTVISVPAVYEDMDIIVYDKPRGMPVHQSPGHYGDSLANVFAAKFPHTPFRAVNRLDKDTSGLCLAAKSRIGANISRENISKVYYAVCCGSITAPMRIDAPIGREDGSALKRTVRSDGKRAVTNVYPLSGNRRYTLLKIILETGRTHQIRVHMSQSGFPLAGDSLYGGDMSDISGQALHCGEMRFVHPVSGRELCLSSPLPEDMLSIVNSL
ncbi:MAG: RluA family pseudouridine synthase [Huintestinicola sp.]|uniref:RluA family pseudouridine synthase n=1 Tax=Huintestinicola sp. TaxID=2981661 RepID=UPI003F0C9FB0